MRRQRPAVRSVPVLPTIVYYSRLRICNDRTALLGHRVHGGGGGADYKLSRCRRHRVSSSWRSHTGRRGRSSPRTDRATILSLVLRLFVHKITKKSLAITSASPPHMQMLGQRQSAKVGVFSPCGQAVSEASCASLNIQVGALDR